MAISNLHASGAEECETAEVKRDIVVCTALDYPRRTFVNRIRLCDTTRTFACQKRSFYKTLQGFL